MGAAISHLRETWHGVHSIISEMTRTSHEFKAVMRRITSPEMPGPEPTVSLWQTSPIYPHLVNTRSEKLPDTADIVIIGSGISGASIAYTVLSECATLEITKRVVILEARETCSGATGRNGGHLKCAPYATYSTMKARFGVESAKKILRFQQQHLPIILDIVNAERLEETEAREVETVDMFTDLGAWENAKAMVRELQQDVPEAAMDLIVWGAKDARKEYGFSKHCQGAISYWAGAMWPYRFVTELYASLLSQYGSSFSLETSAPVTDIKIDGDSSAPYLLHTSRGNIRASHVIHATDSYAPNLIPGLKGKLFPIRAHMTAQKPESFELDGSRSWSIVGKRGFEYVSQRPQPGGELMLGGGLFQSEGKGMDEVGIWQDDKISTTIRAYLAGIWPTVVLQNGASPPWILQAWTGCMGYTVDLLPYVGRLSHKLTGRRVKPSGGKTGKQPPGYTPPGEWISAGFGGDGMVTAWLSGVAVGLMVLGQENLEFQDECGRESLLDDLRHVIESLSGYIHRNLIVCFMSILPQQSSERSRA
ncbi:hypothetical protein BBP40_008786 [Aspergillus hancockii]|nr:hypothetical protein BBP40_008786 [Aspergillus hancockii]